MDWQGHLLGYHWQLILYYWQTSVEPVPRQACSPPFPLPFFVMEECYAPCQFWKCESVSRDPLTPLVLLNANFFVIVGSGSKREFPPRLKMIKTLTN